MLLLTQLLCVARQALTLADKEEQLKFPANTLYRDHPDYPSDTHVEWIPAPAEKLEYHRNSIRDIKLPLDSYRTQEFYQAYLVRRVICLRQELKEVEDWWLSLPGRRIECPEPFYPFRRYYPRRLSSSTAERPVFTASPIATPFIRRCYSHKTDAYDLYGRLRELQKDPLLNFRAGQYHIYMTKKKAKFEELTKQQRRAIKNCLLRK